MPSKNSTWVHFSSSINTGWTLWWTIVGPLRLTVVTVSASKCSSLSICSGFKNKSPSSLIPHTGIRYMGFYGPFVWHNRLVCVKGPKMNFMPGFMWGSSGAAAAEGSGGQLQWSAIFPYWTTLAQPIWLHVTYKKAFYINKFWSFLIRWLILFLNVAFVFVHLDFSSWVEIWKIWNQLWTNLAKPGLLDPAPVLLSLSCCQTIRTCLSHTIPGTHTSPCCA